MEIQGSQNTFNTIYEEGKGTVGQQHEAKINKNITTHDPLLQFFESHSYYEDIRGIYSVGMMLAYLKKENNCIQSYPFYIHWLTFTLYDKCWNDEKKRSLTPAEVLLDPARYIDHSKRILNACEYPIIITEKYRIVDGYHRVIRAIMNKCTFIDVLIFSNDLMKKFMVDESYPELNPQARYELFRRRFSS